MLPLHALFASVDENAGCDEEAFFQRIGSRLHQLCEQIARDIQADSCALFFVTEEPCSGDLRYMVMRGACGRLRRTFNHHVRGWRRFRIDHGPVEAFGGFAYAEKKDEPELVTREVTEWSVTSQIWHLAEGRIANSNRAMDQLHGGTIRIGSGDRFAYPDYNLHTSFRGMIAVPIFAQGGTVPMARLRETNSKRHYPVDASPSGEFLSRYRVVGILKVEGKQPSKGGALVWDELERRLRELFRYLEGAGHSLPLVNRKELSVWMKQAFGRKKAEFGRRPAASPGVAKLFGANGLRFPTMILYNRGANDIEERERVIICRGLVDIFSRTCQAEFTRQDMELLVLMAMQVGRILSRRIIKHAAATKMLVSENEVGSLNIRWPDIKQVSALWRAAEAAKRTVLYNLGTLRDLLDFQRHQEVYGTRVSEFLSPYGPIRSVDARVKEFSSLIRKLLRKELEFNRAPMNARLTLNLAGTLVGYGNNVGQESIMRGRTKMYMHRTRDGRMEGDISCQLGLEDAPRLTVKQRNVRVDLDWTQQQRDSNHSLVHRILGRDWYHVDDLAGARIIADYDSHIDQVLDEIRARAPLWKIDIGPHVDDFRDGKQGGYRALHVTLYVDVGPLLTAEDVRTLREALELTSNQNLSIPVELQLRTAYQNSWALKTHGSSYKREQELSQDLKDQHEILSNVLSEADWLSDIVRAGIEDMLLPNDYGERKLLTFLRRRLSRDEMNVIRFGIACCKVILKDELRYTGEPEFRRAMEVCERLVYSFGELDPRMLLLALMRNLWRAEYRFSAVSNELPDLMADSVIEDYCERLRRRCGTILDLYKPRLPLSPAHLQSSDWLEQWCHEFPAWFWAVHRSFRDYFLKPLEDPTSQWKERLRLVYKDLDRRHKMAPWPETLKEWLERAYMMEAAVLLSTLTELPFEPGKARRKRLHDQYLSLYREIRRYLPNGAVKTRIVQEMDRVFRDIETQFDLPREAEWWGE